MVETLGHSQIRLMMSIYSHVLPALQVEAAAKMDYQGKTYHFCSAACHEAFKGEPAKYATA